MLEKYSDLGSLDADALALIDDPSSSSGQKGNAKRSNLLLRYVGCFDEVDYASSSDCGAEGQQC